MKIVLVGPGIMPIPPVGWGAVESVIWDLSTTLKNLGHEVFIVNKFDTEEIINEINSIDPDFVHFHYETIHYKVLSCINYPKAITSHNSYSHTIEKNVPMQDAIKEIIKSKTSIFSLSQEIKDIYLNEFKIKSENVFVIPNGINTDTFKTSFTPKKYDKSIFLGKVEDRKRQYIVSDFKDIDFFGPIESSYSFTSENYYGEVSKKEICDNLTDYGNLVLLSEDEGQPLVCLEALSAGLGLVITKNAADNLDLDLPFITIIDENLINNKEYLSLEIAKNREYSIANRKDILRYSKKFEWKNIVEKYYVPAVESIILLEGLK